MNKSQSTNEEKFELLFNSIADAVFLADVNSRKIIDCNKNAEKLTGYSQKEIFTMQIDQFHPKDLAKKSIKEFESSKKNSNIIETEIETKNKERIAVSINTSLVQLDGRKIMLGIFRDISEQKKSQKTLEERDAMMKSIFKAAPTGIGVVIDRKFQFVNQKFIDMVGYSKKELLGQGSRMIYPSQEEFERVGKYKYKQIEEKGTGSIETQLLRKDGHILDVLLSSTPIDVNDLSKGVTFTTTDITERKSAEKALKKKVKELESFNKTAVDRELKMIELKKKIKELEKN